MNFLRLCLIAFCCACAMHAHAQQTQKELDKITFGTNWLAQGEHGGFYQAVADGTYKRYGLDVTISPGGPQANQRLSLAVGKIDFYMGANMLEPFGAVQNNVPVTVVAAMFQKDPQIFMAHPNTGAEKFEDLKTRTLFLSRMIEATVFRWMQAAYGFERERVKPYNSNIAPFCLDKNSAQQGYATSEPYTVEKACGFSPQIFFLSDAGYDSYSTTIETRHETIEKNPQLVQRFVDASIIGWKNYLHGDNSAANAMIKRDNPDMDDARLTNSLEKMRVYNFAEQGEAATQGIGAMNDARHKQFFDAVVKAGLFPADLDYKKSYTLQFVNKGLGLETVKN